MNTIQICTFNELNKADEANLALKNVRNFVLCLEVKNVDVLNALARPEASG